MFVLPLALYALFAIIGAYFIWQMFFGKEDETPKNETRKKERREMNNVY